MTTIQRTSSRLWGCDMGLLDEFITDMAKKPEPGKDKKPDQGGMTGAFDKEYSKDFIEYCNKNPLSEGKK